MQREDMVAAMTDIMANFTSYLGKHLPDDIMEKLGQLRSAEDTPLAKVVYDSMFENLAKADALNRPCCQDTGVIPVLTWLRVLERIRNSRSGRGPSLATSTCSTRDRRSGPRRTPATNCSSRGAWP